jgi:RHS repeat-associated protein
VPATRPALVPPPADEGDEGPWGEELEGNFSKVTFTFTGHRREPRTGMLSALHRYLDPRAGRWTSQDPMGSRDGPNRYLYVHARPLSFIDPSGLLTFEGPFPEGWSLDKFKKIQAELESEFSQPAESLCVSIPVNRCGTVDYCNVCTPLNYLKMLKDPEIRVRINPIGGDVDFGYTPQNGQKYLEIRGASLLDGSGASAKETIIHELTHVAGYAHGEEGFRWIHFARNKLKTYTGWSGVKPCDTPPGDTGR